MKVTAKTSQRETRVQSNYNGLHFLITFFIVILLGNIQTGYAQTAYNPGKLAVLVVGDGTAALTGSATPVFVKELKSCG